jgi:lipoprotein signal peptidase
VTGTTDGHGNGGKEHWLRALMVRKWLFWLVVVIVLASDLATKEWAEKNITREVPLRVSDPALGNPTKLMPNPDIGERGAEDQGQQFIPGVLHFKWAENYGAAFSIGSDSRGILLVLSFGILGIVLYYTHRTPVRMKFALVCLGVITGGAVGNIYDRLFFDTVDGRQHLIVDGAWAENPRFGHPTTAVRDFLYWPFDIPLYSTLFLETDETGKVIEETRKWPIFNIADVGIVSGVVGVMAVIAFAPNPARRREDDEGAAAPGSGAVATGGMPE